MIVTDLLVVGGGASGTAAVCNLIRQGFEGSIFWTEGCPALLGRGTAYSGVFRDVPLNVTANRMSLWEDDPQGFLNFARQKAYAANEHDFLPRALYGDYLQQEIRKWETIANGKLCLASEEVTDLKVEPEGVYFFLAGGGIGKTQRVILATGNRSPRLSTVFAGYSGWLNAWDHPAEELEATQHIFILGSGLSMIDQILALDQLNWKGRVTVLSRHGRLPVSHASLTGTPPLPFSWRLKDILNWWRQQRRSYSNTDLAVALRPHIAAIYRGFDFEERHLFHSAYRHRWEVIRHRIPKESDVVIKRWISEGRLKVYAGQLKHLEEEASGIRIFWTSRTRKFKQTTAEAAVLAIGQQTEPTSLFRAMLSRGQLQLDAYAYAPLADEYGALLNQRGHPQPIFGIGPVLRARDWESTAMHEIRLQAAALANHLLENEANNSHALMDEQ